MVPHDERERLENLFKGDSDAVNAFVCTPTLELGVDIGQLDAVLMRNVPPLPANYWQRAGRAGRRHRMAVDLTYCRPVSHDRAYFAEPMKLLAGRVDPPAFNLRNELMVAKHVHATVITRLHQYARDASRSEDGAPGDRRHAARPACRTGSSAYLFEDGLVREQPFDLAPLRALIEPNARRPRRLRRRAPSGRAGRKRRGGRLVLRRCGPRRRDGRPSLKRCSARLSPAAALGAGPDQAAERVREQQGDLEPEDEALFRRCDALVKRLKGTARRARREAEGYDDVNTFGVLAAEGFLPGYGLEVGSVLGTAEIPFWRTGAMEFALPRPPSVALREYVPGNLIYANGNRFVARRFHRDIDEQRVEMPVFEVSTERQAVKETNAGCHAPALWAPRSCRPSRCATSTSSTSRTSPTRRNCASRWVSRSTGSSATSTTAGARTAGASRACTTAAACASAWSTSARRRPSSRSSRFGYPVCTVCGQSVSPLSSERQREQFDESHEERCGRKVEPIGFYADVVADVLSLPACPDQRTAYSVLEALRFAATRVLDMHMDDLQILVIGHVDRDEVDALLWDPMPGGSGLLDQICERFDEIVGVARDVVENCPSACETSCIDCLQTFRNGYYHKHLDRKARPGASRGVGSASRRVARDPAEAALAGAGGGSAPGQRSGAATSAPAASGRLRGRDPGRADPARPGDRDDHAGRHLPRSAPRRRRGRLHLPRRPERPSARQSGDRGAGPADPHVAPEQRLRGDRDRGERP